MGKSNKTHGMGKVWEIDAHTFPTVWVLFSHQIPIPSYGMLHHMGNAWVSPSISHSTGKCNKTHRMGCNWEIGNHTFPIVWVIFPHTIPIPWYTSSNGKCIGLSINFPQYRKMQQNPSYGEKLGNWYSYFSHNTGTFSIRFPFYGILHHMGYVITSISVSTIFPFCVFIFTFSFLIFSSRNKFYNLQCFIPIFHLESYH